MHICIDSSALVIGLKGMEPAATRILELVGRHFLKELQTDAFEVLEAVEFVKLWEIDNA